MTKAFTLHSDRNVEQGVWVVSKRCIFAFTFYLWVISPLSAAVGLHCDTAQSEFDKYLCNAHELAKLVSELNGTYDAVVSHKLEAWRARCIEEKPVDVDEDA